MSCPLVPVLSLRVFRLLYAILTGIIPTTTAVTFRRSFDRIDHVAITLGPVAETNEWIAFVRRVVGSPPAPVLIVRGVLVVLPTALTTIIPEVPVLAVSELVDPTAVATAPVLAVDEPVTSAG